MENGGEKLADKLSVYRQNIIQTFQAIMRSIAGEKNVLTRQIRTLSSLCFFSIPFFHGLTCLPQAVQKRFSRTATQPARKKNI